MRTTMTAILAGTLMAAASFAGMTNQWQAERFRAKMGRSLTQQKPPQAAHTHVGHAAGGCCHLMQEACCR